MKRLLTILAILASVGLWAQTEEGSVTSFRKPDKVIEALTMSSPLPQSWFSNDYKTVVLGYRQCKSVPVSELAASELRIGGVRMDPKTFSETRQNYMEKLEVLDVASGNSRYIKGMPGKAKIQYVTWSPDGKKFCFTNTTDRGVDLYRVDITQDELVAELINKYRVNAIFGQPYIWLDNNTILYRSVPELVGAIPTQKVAKSSVVQENLGKKKESVRTFQDLLNGPFDEKLYDYCCKSILAIVSPEGTRTIGEASVWRSLDPSPDGKYIIAVTEHHPYSYVEGHRSFPSKQFIMDLDGNMVKMLSDGTLKKDESEKAKKEAKPSGFSWRNDLPAVLTWKLSKVDDETPEGPRPGDDETKADKDKPERLFVDTLFQCGAPFNFESDKTPVAASKYRLGRITWGNSNLALYEESSSKQKFRRTVTFVPCDLKAKSKVLFTESTAVDTLGNFPAYGRPYLVKNAFGKNVVWSDSKNSYVYFNGRDRRDEFGFGVSFIDKVNVADGQRTNVWTEKGTMKESLIGISDLQKLKIIETKEAFCVVPDYYETDIRKGTSRQLTQFVDPVPQVKDLMTKQYVSYTRKDGLRCYANLYLPKGYDKVKDGRLPVFMWTYPYDYKCAAECDKSRPERYKYTKPTYGSAMIWASQGYAVLDEFTMAIIAADKDSLANDMFQQQLVMSAEAAVDFIVDTLGIGDRNRIGVGGHSYGAYMTANLLAHTKLFRAGIARSGAYNRSLTPFGFQNESRNFWKAQQLYDDMSPFNYADKIKDAILLIHGQQDNNQGTFPIQSERLYQALVYFGGTARYVQLPYESHSYLGRETTLDMLYETGRWLDKYVKNAKPRNEK